MTDEDLKELAYHLRELRADLGLIRSDLLAAALPDVDRSASRAWTGAWAMLEHDLEVHLPRALTLLGKALPLFQTSKARRDDDAAFLNSAAREARGLVDSALAALPPDDVDPVVALNKLTDISIVVYAAFQIAEEMLRVVSPDEEGVESEE